MLLLLPLILIGQSYLPHFGNCQKTKLSDALSIKIMSYNVWEFNKDQIAMTEVIKQEKPEILLLQEIKPNWIQKIKNTLNKQYSGSLHVAYEPSIKLAVISIYPLKKTEAFTQKTRAQKVVIKTPFGLMTVINIHAIKKKGWKYKHLQMKKLLEDDIVPEKGPLIFGGDFNTNEQSQSYKMINKYLDNAHSRVGCGYGFTYPARPSLFTVKHYSILPVIRIDHIFYSNHLILLSARTIYESGGSDHFPIVARFLFKTSS